MAALHDLDLTAAQKTTIQAAMDKLAPPARGERGPRDGAAFTALSAGVRAGKIDTAAVLASLGAPDHGPGARGAEIATALQTLHDTLTKEQRRALVDGPSLRGSSSRASGPRRGARAADRARRRRDHRGPAGHRSGRAPRQDVIDRGIGIAAEDLPRVFRPFFRADRSRARATGGLGLALAKRIVDAHGGEITLESAPNEGTRARVHLPVAGDTD